MRVSDCCGERVLGSDEDPICSGCREHCEAVNDEEEGDEDAG